VAEKDRGSRLAALLACKKLRVGGQPFVWCECIGFLGVAAGREHYNDSRVCEEATAEELYDAWLDCGVAGSEAADHSNAECVPLQHSSSARTAAMRDSTIRSALGLLFGLRSTYRQRAQRSAEGRERVKEYKRQANAPGNEPTMRARPKDTDKSSAFSGAIP
jgi:hypothetical protein